ncbi:MAG: DUF4911 domain-containing protein [Deltaproteobacteria bacterium]|uniref:DUF4911 domain-containing protein n=1 Tax=Candidatus Zymogenus saltonus TaxID=2844893 RepID=A0A9D8PNJ0_9DELT|nr:DUF4911 domain-containing protein [Candidatus Zymogenus saltonus]
METTEKYYKIRRDGIALLKYIIESYDGAAAVRTVDREGMILEIMIAPGFEGVVDGVIEELSDELGIVAVERPDNIDPL